MATHHGKGFIEARAKIDREREYTPAEAICARQGGSSARSSTSPSRSTCAPGSTSATPTSSCAARSPCPHGLGKEVKIAVFAQGDKAREAEEAGADIVGAEDLAKKVEEGFTDFDVAIATPDLMPVVGRLGRVLGPQGKMPNPKVGTVTMDVAQGRRGVQVRQGRVPHRPHRHRAPGDRQDELRRAAAAGELRSRDRGAHARQAVCRQGQVPPDRSPWLRPWARV